MRKYVPGGDPWSTLRLGIVRLAETLYPMVEAGISQNRVQFAIKNVPWSLGQMLRHDEQLILLLPFGSSQRHASTPCRCLRRAVELNRGLPRLAFGSAVGKGVVIGHGFWKSDAYFSFVQGRRLFLIAFSNAAKSLWF
jgi:hypothetical protein